MFCLVGFLFFVLFYLVSTLSDYFLLGTKEGFDDQTYHLVPRTCKPVQMLEMNSEHSILKGTNYTSLTTKVEWKGLVSRMSFPFNKEYDKQFIEHTKRGEKLISH